MRYLAGEGVQQEAPHLVDDHLPPDPRRESQHCWVTRVCRVDGAREHKQAWVRARVRETQTCRGSLSRAEDSLGRVPLSCASLSRAEDSLVCVPLS